MADKENRRQAADEKQRIERLKKIREHQYLENEQRRCSKTVSALKKKEREA